MTKSIFPTFSSGEVAPDLTSSPEFERAKFGVKQCTNMIVDPLGGVKSAPGTQFVDYAIDTTKKPRLRKFQFNTEQGYQIELGDLTFQIIKDGAYIIFDLVDSAVYKWTISGSGTGEYYLELLAGGNPSLVLPSRILENNAIMNVGSFGSLLEGQWAWGDNDALGYITIYVRIIGSVDPDTKSNGYLTAPVIVATPYNKAAIQLLNFAPSADTLYCFHPTIAPHKITRTSNVDWTITLVDLQDGPYKPRVAGDEDVSVEIKWIGSWKVESDTSIFGDTEEGDHFRLGFPIPADPTAIFWRWFKVSSVFNDKEISVLLQGPLTTNPSYQQIINPLFEEGLSSWQDISTGSLGRISYDFATKRAILTELADGQPTEMEQPVITFANSRHRIAVNVAAMSGTSPTVYVKIGTTSGTGDILTSGAITAPGAYSYEFLPTQETIYVNFITTGSATNDVIEIGGTEIYYVGEKPTSSFHQTVKDWRLGAWNSNHGYPQHGTIHDQSLYCAEITTEPQTIWKSETANFESFAFNTPSLSTDSFSFLPSTEEINGIQWFVKQAGLKLATSGEIWNIFAASGGAITSSDVNISVDASIGSLDLNPLVIGNSIIMTPRGFTAVAELTSSFETSSYIPRNISILANHLFKDRRIVSWDYAENPDSVIWCVLDDGQLLGLTYIKEYDIWAWHKHTTELGFGYVDVSVIPNSNDDNIDDVYFVINRAEDGATPNYYIEKQNKGITPQEAAFGLSASGSPFDYKFLHSALTLDDPRTITNITKANPAVVTSTAHGYIHGGEIRIQNVKGMTEVNNEVYTVANPSANHYELSGINSTGFGAYISGGEGRKMETVISGLRHLEGRTLIAIADGARRTGLTVSGGSVTLSQAASFIHIGVPYTPEIETIDIEIIVEEGNTQGRIKGLTGAHIYFKDTKGAEIATSSDKDKWISILFHDEAYGQDPSPLFDGIKEARIPSYNGSNERLKVRGVPGLPIHIKRLIPDVKYSR